MSEKKGFFKRLAQGLSKTRDNIASSFDSIFSGYSSIDDDFYDEIEETLVMGDIGINATTAIIDNLKQKVKEQHIKDPHECKELLINSIKEQMLKQTIQESRESIIIVDNNYSIVHYNDKADIAFKLTENSQASLKEIFENVLPYLGIEQKE